MLRARAVGRIVAGATPNSAISAMYADAPAWPTDVYSAAPSNMQAARNNTWISGTLRDP